MAEFDMETEPDPIRSGIFPEQFRQIGGQIATFLDDPRARAGLINAGLSLMSGATWGDTPSSQIARAIGKAGEGVTAQEEATTKQELAESKMDVAEARAGAAGARARSEADRLDIARDRNRIEEEHKKGMRAKWNAQADLAERDYVRKIRKLELDVQNAATKEERDAKQFALDQMIAEAKIKTDEIRTGQADQRIQLQRQGVQQQGRRGVLEGHISVDRAYQSAIKADKEANEEIARRNSLYRESTPLKPIPSKSEWLARPENERLRRAAEPDEDDDGGGASTPRQWPTPNEDQLQMLRQSRDDPRVIQFFERKFGPGSSRRYLEGR